MRKKLQQSCAGGDEDAGGVKVMDAFYKLVVNNKEEERDRLEYYTILVCEYVLTGLVDHVFRRYTENVTYSAARMKKIEREIEKLETTIVMLQRLQASNTGLRIYLSAFAYAVIALCRSATGSQENLEIAVERLEKIPDLTGKEEKKKELLDLLCIAEKVSPKDNEWKEKFLDFEITFDTKRQLGNFRAGVYKLDGTESSYIKELFEYIRKYRKSERQIKVRSLRAKSFRDLKKIKESAGGWRRQLEHFIKFLESNYIVSEQMKKMHGHLLAIEERLRRNTLEAYKEQEEGPFAEALKYFNIRIVPTEDMLAKSMVETPPEKREENAGNAVETEPALKTPILPDPVENDIAGDMIDYKTQDSRQGLGIWTKIFKGKNNP